MTRPECGCVAERLRKAKLLSSTTGGTGHSAGWGMPALAEVD